MHLTQRNISVINRKKEILFGLYHYFVYFCNQFKNKYPIYEDQRPTARSYQADHFQ